MHPSAFNLGGGGMGVMIISLYYVIRDEIYEKLYYIMLFTKLIHVLEKHKVFICRFCLLEGGSDQ